MCVNTNYSHDTTPQLVTPGITPQLVTTGITPQLVNPKNWTSRTWLHSLLHRMESSVPSQLSADDLQLRDTPHEYSHGAIHVMDSIKLPHFCRTNSAKWFVVLEMTFALKHIKSDATKFIHSTHECCE